MIFFTLFCLVLEKTEKKIQLETCVNAVFFVKKTSFMECFVVLNKNSVFCLGFCPEKKELLKVNIIFLCFVEAGF